MLLQPVNKYRFKHYSFNSRVSIRKTFAQFFAERTAKFFFLCALVLREKKQQFAHSFAKVISRKIALFRICETQALAIFATRVLHNSAIS